MRELSDRVEEDLGQAPLQTSGAFHLWPGAVRRPLPWSQGLPERSAVGPGVGLGQLRVQALPLEPPRALPPTTPLSEICERLRHGDGWVAVAEGERLVGLVEPVAVLEAVAKGQLTTAATSLMTRSVPSCGLTTRVVDAVQIMLTNRLRRLPVLDEGRYVGVLSLSVAVAAADADPLVREVLERATAAPGLFARPLW